MLPTVKPRPAVARRDIVAIAIHSKIWRRYFSGGCVECWYQLQGINLRINLQLSNKIFDDMKYDITFSSNFQWIFD